MDELKKLKEKLKFRYDNFKSEIGEVNAYGYAAYKTIEELIDYFDTSNKPVITDYKCEVCQKVCKNKLGLIGHSKTHELHKKK